MSIQISFVNLMLTALTKSAEGTHVLNPRECMQTSIILHPASWRTHMSAHETHENLLFRAHTLGMQPMKILGFWSGFGV